MKGKLIFVSVPADNPERAAGFYGKMLGIGFARSLTDEMEAYHAPISNEGAIMNIHTRLREGQQISCCFAVEDLDVALEEFQAEGGLVISPPRKLPIHPRGIDRYHDANQEHFDMPSRSLGETESMGSFAVVKDPEGNSLILMQLEKHAHASFKLSNYALEAKEGEFYQLSSAILRAHEQAMEGAEVLDKGLVPS